MDYDKVMEFLGRVTTDMAATGAAGSTVIGNRLGLYGRSRRARRPPSSSPNAPGTTCGTSPNGCTSRRRASTSATNPPRANST